MHRLTLFVLLCLVLGCQNSPETVQPSLTPSESHVAPPEAAAPRVEVPECEALVMGQAQEDLEASVHIHTPKSGQQIDRAGSDAPEVEGEVSCPIRLADASADEASLYTRRAKQWSQAALEGGALHVPGDKTRKEMSEAVELWVKGCGLLQVESAVIREGRDAFLEPYDSTMLDVVMLELDYELDDGRQARTKELVLAARSQGLPWRFELLRVDHNESASYYRFDIRPMTFLLSGSFGESGGYTYMRYEVLEELMGRGRSSNSTIVQITVLLDSHGHVKHTWIDGRKTRDFQDNDDLGGEDVEAWGHCEANVTFDRKGRLVADIVQKEGGTSIEKSVKKRALRLDTKDVAPTHIHNPCALSRP